MFSSGETEVNGMWALPQASHRMRGKWVFPGRDNICAEDGISSDETNIICVNDYWIIMHKIGISANSQEVFSAYASDCV